MLVQAGKVVLRNRQSLLCRCLILVRSFHVVLLDAETVFIEIAKHELRMGQAMTCSKAKPADGFFVVAHYARAVQVGTPEPVLSVHIAALSFCFYK